MSVVWHQGRDPYLRVGTGLDGSVRAVALGPIVELPADEVTGAEVFPGAPSAPPSTPEGALPPSAPSGALPAPELQAAVSALQGYAP